MADLTTDDLVLDLGAYEQQRAEVRARVIALKKRRRVHVGDIVTFVFENRETLRFQVQEMVFTEEMSDPAAIAGELATYNPLLPTPTELSATMFLEIPDMATLKAELPRLARIEHSVSLRVGDERVPGIGEEGRSRDDYTSTVHYLRFPLTDTARAGLLDPTVPVLIEVDHPNYSEVTPLRDDVRRSLIADLAL